MCPNMCPNKWLCPNMCPQKNMPVPEKNACAINSPTLFSMGILSFFATIWKANSLPHNFGHRYRNRFRSPFSDTVSGHRFGHRLKTPLGAPFRSPCCLLSPPPSQPPGTSTNTHYYSSTGRQSNLATWRAQQLSQPGLVGKPLLNLTKWNPLNPASPLFTPPWQPSGTNNLAEPWQPGRHSNLASTEQPCQIANQ